MTGSGACLRGRTRCALVFFFSPRLTARASPMACLHATRANRHQATADRGQRIHVVSVVSRRRRGLKRRLRLSRLVTAQEVSLPAEQPLMPRLRAIIHTAARSTMQVLRKVSSGQARQRQGTNLGPLFGRQTPPVPRRKRRQLSVRRRGSAATLGGMTATATAASSTRTVRHRWDSPDVCAHTARCAFSHNALTAGHLAVSDPNAPAAIARATMMIQGAAPCATGKPLETLRLDAGGGQSDGAEAAAGSGPSAQEQQEQQRQGGVAAAEAPQHHHQQQQHGTPTLEPREPSHSRQEVALDPAAGLPQEAAEASGRQPGAADDGAGTGALAVYGDIDPTEVVLKVQVCMPKGDPRRSQVRSVLQL